MRVVPSLPFLFLFLFFFVGFYLAARIASLTRDERSFAPSPSLSTPQWMDGRMDWMECSPAALASAAAAAVQYVHLSCCNCKWLASEASFFSLLSHSSQQQRRVYWVGRREKGDDDDDDDDILSKKRRRRRGAIVQYNCNIRTYTQNRYNKERNRRVGGIYKALVTHSIVR